jgi:hypothetical protein
MIHVATNPLMQDQNPPPKKRYGYFGRWKGYFLKKFRKNPVITVAL